ncbi:PINIT domain-containing protein [Sparassis latifolia]|uniref:E3 SUMO-protein ligase pli1 n=1 Tax=Sparassis crispa TaxID=139825 RepID=A0A401G762_9APHY|nr:predicted protein [Sparassis crispa]GBE78006.1 predicted protein [Sparassis crispa]
MATSWDDFETSRHNVKLNTVDRLKQILTGFNEECQTNLTKSGKKQELIERITRELDQWRRTNNIDKWAKARVILNQVRTIGMYSPTRMSGEHSFTTSVPPHKTYPAASSVGHGYQSSVSGSSSSLPRYDPYAPARIPTATHPSTSTVHPPTPSIRFKPSPFFRVERAVSSVVECPESTSALDRRQQSIVFTMPNDVVMKLNSSNPTYQLRLYCTSSTYYMPSSAFRTTSGPCPIEFPPTCEVRVNGVPLTANLKGMKKKPGTAPPPDLGKSLRTSSGASNRIEMVYVNSQQPVLSKKYYLVVMLVETTTVDQLIERLKKGKYKSSHDIVTKMAQSAATDDDIVAGQQKMSLKCPLSYMRIVTPCRSSLCVHSQCFDALSWFSLMEQTTTWLCPVCEKVLNPEDLIVDGYFDEILKQTPESVEDVLVESDGQWHSSDNKCGSAEWKAAHSPAKVLAALHPAPAVKRADTPVKVVPNGVNGEAKSGPSNAEIVILDSDDEDEGRVKRELSPSYDGAPGSSNVSQASLPPRSQSQSTDVIDLTLDSEDEDSPTTLSRKRKTVEIDLPSPTEQIWKKSRSEASVPASTHTAGSSHSSYLQSPHFPASRELASRSLSGAIPTSSSSYQPSYPGTGGAQYLPMALPPRRPPGTVHNEHYSDITNPYMPRINGGGSASPNSWRL